MGQFQSDDMLCYRGGGGGGGGVWAGDIDTY